MSSICFNPHCPTPTDAENIAKSHCQSCGTSLLLGDRFRNLQILNHSQFSLTSEVLDLENNVTKILKILVSQHPRAKALFEQEAYVLQTINHKGIPKIEPDGCFVSQDRGWLLNRSCIVMEKIEGISLAQWLQQDSPQFLSNQQTHHWLVQLTEILEQLHTQAFFHRDLKPSNILLKPDGQLVLIDFGAAREITETYLSKVGGGQDLTCIGTPGYTPPEQLEGMALPQSDFFALGRTLVHLLTQKHPLELPKHPKTGELMWRDEAPELSKDLGDFIDRMMAHFPGHRPANIQVIQQQLEKISQRLPSLYPQKNISFLQGKIKSIKRNLSILPSSSRAIFNLKWFIPVFLSIGAFTMLMNRLLIPSISVAKRSTIPVSCQNIACINRDAVDNHCQQDVQSITSNVGNFRQSKNYLKAYKIELRYSKACQSTWVRDESPAKSVHYVEDLLGKRYGTSIIPIDGNPNHYSDMGPGQGIKIRACAQPPSEKVTCTSFVQL
jgi:serine/threonine protein kinase